MSPAGGTGGSSRRETGHRSRKKAGNRRRDFRAGKSPPERLRGKTGHKARQRRGNSHSLRQDGRQLPGGSGRKFPPGDRPQEPQEGQERAEGLPGGEIPAGTSEGQNRPQSAAGIGVKKYIDNITPVFFRKSIDNITPGKANTAGGQRRRLKP